MDIYVVEPPHGLAAITPWLIYGATAVLALVATWRLGRRGWAVATVLALLVPNLVVLLAGEGHVGPSHMAYVMEIVLPLAVMGAPAAVVGAVAGWLLRRRRA